MQVGLADQIWIGTALLHQEQPKRAAFSVKEILERVAQEGFAGGYRPGLQTHAVQHCLANKPPAPNSYRMLYALAEGGRRLFRKGDDFHPHRRDGRVTPEPKAVPSAYWELIRWYYQQWDTSWYDLPDDYTYAPTPGFMADLELAQAERDEKQRAAAAGHRIALVSCVKSKLEHPARAQDLYTSALFKKARAWAERHCNGWYILSAKHGLVAPSVELHPYELTLRSLKRHERLEWAHRVHVQMREAGLLGKGVTLVWLAGAPYKKELAQLLSDFEQEDPLRGLGIGKRLQWLSANVQGGPNVPR